MTENWSKTLYLCFIVNGIIATDKEGFFLSYRMYKGIENLCLNEIAYLVK